MALGGGSEGRLGGRPTAEPGAVIGAARGRRPPAVWGNISVEDDLMVVKLSGWRSVWAVTRGIKVPLECIVAVDHDPGVYSRVPTKARMITKQRSGVIKLGAYHSRDGWSFWACGLGRNAVVIDTKDFRYATVVVEVENPVATVRTLREAAGLPVLGTTTASPSRAGSVGRRPRKVPLDSGGSGRSEKDSPSPASGPIDHGQPAARTGERTPGGQPGDAGDGEKDDAP
jgi:hypothetical protein